MPITDNEATAAGELTARRHPQGRRIVNHRQSPRFSAFPTRRSFDHRTGQAPFGESPISQASVFSSRRGSLLLGVLVVGLALTTGCNVFEKNDKSLGSGQMPLQGSDSAEIFQRIREAKSQNAVVVQVAGDSTPVRVLPLPPDGRSVYVSDLLTQTGIQEKVGSLRATLYRANPQTPSGIPMEVRFDPSGGSVRPDSDYALQPGDRLKVSKAEKPLLGGILDQIIPGNRF